MDMIQENLGELSDEQLYLTCKEYGEQAKKWQLKFASLLPEVHRRMLYKKKRFVSIHEFTAKLGGMSPHSVDRILCLARKLADKPKLKNELESGHTHWSKIEKVATIATPETEEAWVQKVRTLPRPALEIAVQEARRENPQLVELEIQSQEEEWHTFSIRVFSQVEKDLRLKKFELEKSLKKILSWNEFFQFLLQAGSGQQGVAREKIVQVEICPRCVKEETQENSENKRHIPQKVRDILRDRHGGMCVFRGCKRPAEIFHHTRRFSLNSSHDPDFITPLCKAHERFVHSGLIEDETRAPKDWRVLASPNILDPKYSVDQRVQDFWRGG